MGFIELTLCEKCAEGYVGDKISINFDQVKSFNEHPDGTFIEMHMHEGKPVGWKVKEDYSRVKRSIENGWFIKLD